MAARRCVSEGDTCARGGRGLRCLGTAEMDGEGAVVGGGVGVAGLGSLEVAAAGGRRWALEGEVVIVMRGDFDFVGRRSL